MADWGQETQSVAEAVFELDGKKIHLIDTPDFFEHATNSGSDIWRQVATWLRMAYGTETRLNGVVYLHRISDPRMRGTAAEDLLTFSRLMGNEGSSKVVHVTTMWDEVDQNLGQARELELSRYWRFLVEEGSSMYRYDGTRASALRIISSLSSVKQYKRLATRRESVFKAPLLDRKEAGRASFGIEERERKLLGELEDVERQIQSPNQEKKQMHLGYKDFREAPTQEDQDLRAQPDLEMEGRASSVEQRMSEPARVRAEIMGNRGKDHYYHSPR